MMDKLTTVPGLKRKDLRPCVGCGRGVMHDNNLTFYRLRIDYLLADLRAIQRQAGLDMFIGNPSIGHIMGPNEDLAATVSRDEALVCLECAVRHSLVSLSERISARADQTTATPEAGQETAR